MTETTRPRHPLEAENAAFLEKAERSLRDLLNRAKTRNELQFAFSLTPEFRGMQDPGWSTAADAQVAFEDYMTFLKDGEFTRLKARVALGFYCHLSESAGFYEIPKNMLRVAEGELYQLWPFQELVEVHRQSGVLIAPNANRVLRDLTRHAMDLGLHDLAEVFRDAFDPDLRNGYSHADYVVWNDGIRLRKRDGGQPRIVVWPEFRCLLDRGVNFFHTLRQIVAEYISSYHPAKSIRGRLGDAPEQIWTIHADPESGTFEICG